MDSISRYNGELALLNRQLNDELMRSDILKSEELGTCEFISEVAAVYLEVVKSCKLLPFTLPQQLEIADKKILENIFIDRKNLIAARSSFFLTG
jgi:hypothetical protein